MSKDEALVEAVLDDFESAPLDERRKAMLRYVSLLTQAPSRVGRDDVAQLRDAGFEDADILAIVEVAGYYAYANRIADGLGVQLEPDRDG